MTTQELTEQALWEAHSALNNTKEKLLLLRKSSTTPRDRFRLLDMVDWIDEANKCLLQVDLLLHRRETAISKASKHPRSLDDRRKIPFKPKPRGATPPKEEEDL